MGRHRHAFVLGAILVFAVLIALSDAAVANAAPGLSSGSNSAVTPGDVDSIVNLARTSARAWRHSLIAFGAPLFWALATIQFTYGMGKLVLRGSEVNEQLTYAFDSFMRIGFWVLVREKSDTWIPMIVESLQQAGAKTAASVAGGEIRPQLLWDEMVDLAVVISDRSGTWEMITSGSGFGVFFGLAIVFISYGFCAAFVWICYIRAYVVMGAGAVLLSFAGSTWTEGVAHRYIQAVAGCGLHLLVLELVKGLTLGVLVSWLTSAKAGSELGMDMVLKMALGGMAIAVILASTPSVVSGIMSGGSVGGTAESVFTRMTSSAARMVSPLGANAALVGGKLGLKAALFTAAATVGAGFTAGSSLVQRFGGRSSGGTPPSGGNGGGSAPRGPSGGTGNLGSGRATPPSFGAGGSQPSSGGGGRTPPTGGTGARGAAGSAVPPQGSSAAGSTRQAGTSPGASPGEAGNRSRDGQAANGNGPNGGGGSARSNQGARAPLTRLE